MRVENELNSHDTNRNIQRTIESCHRNDNVVKELFKNVTVRGRPRTTAEATASSRRSCPNYNSRRTSEDRNQSDNVVRDLSENVEDPEEEHCLMEDITR